MHRPSPLTVQVIRDEESNQSTIDQGSIPMPSSSSLNRVSKTRSVVNLAIGVLVLIIGSWWVVATYVNAQKSLKASSEEWARLQRCIDRRWSKLSDLSKM